jgi:hypothetical protein
MKVVSLVQWSVDFVSLSENQKENRYLFVMSGSKEPRKKTDRGKEQLPLAGISSKKLCTHGFLFLSPVTSFMSRGYILLTSMMTYMLFYIYTII